MTHFLKYFSLLILLVAIFSLFEKVIVNHANANFIGNASLQFSSSPVAPETLPSALLEYNANEASGVNDVGGFAWDLYDLTANGVDADAPSGQRPAYGSRTFNGADSLDLDGTDHFDIDVTNNKILDRFGFFADPTQGSWQLQFVGAGDSSGTFLAKAGGTGASRQFQLFQDFNTGDIKLIVRGNEHTLEDNYTNGEAFSIGIQYDAVADEMYYKMHDDSSWTELTIGTASEETGEEICIGGRTGGTNFQLNGAFMYLRVWEEALSDAQTDAANDTIPAIWGVSYTDLVSSGAASDGSLAFPDGNIFTLPDDSTLIIP